MSESLKQKGNDEFKRGNYQSADEYYKQAIELSPDNAVLFSNRAMSLIKIDRWEECLDVCQQGLKLKSIDDKTRIKLLWRSGIAYMNLNQFIESRRCFNEALAIERTNKSIKTSIEELEKKEQLFKRSRSEESLFQEKRLKTNTKISIPIFEVDKLPKEFLLIENEPAIPFQSSIQPNPVRKETLKTDSKTSKPATSNIVTKVSNQPGSARSYPIMPTVYQLSTIIKTADDSTYIYGFGLSTEVLKSLFARGNIDFSFVNFFLSSIHHALSKETITKSSIEKAVHILNTLSDAPRFPLTQMMFDKQRIIEIRNIMYEYRESFSNEVELDIDDVMKPWGI